MHTARLAAEIIPPWVLQGSRVLVIVPAVPVTSKKEARCRRDTVFSEGPVQLATCHCGAQRRPLYHCRGFWCADVCSITGRDGLALLVTLTSKWTWLSCCPLAVRVLMLNCTSGSSGCPCLNAFESGDPHTTRLRKGGGIGGSAWVGGWVP